MLPETGLRETSPRLRTSVAGLDFPPPVGLPAGVDQNAEVPDAMLRQGFGFVEVGTLTPPPQHGNPTPRAFRLTGDPALIHPMGFHKGGTGAPAQRTTRRHGKP